MLLVSYECSRSFAARGDGAFAGALSTGWATPRLAVARRTASLAGGLTSCAASCTASAIALAATAAITALGAATRGIRPATLAAFPALAAATAAGTSLPAGALVALVGKLSHRLAACLATATLISLSSAHISRLHQAFLIEPNQIQATGLRKRLHH